MKKCCVFQSQISSYILNINVDQYFSSKVSVLVPKKPTSVKPLFVFTHIHTQQWEHTVEVGVEGGWFTID